MNHSQNALRNDVVYGRNSVMETLKGDREIDNIYIQKGEAKGSLLKIKAMAAERSVPVKEASIVKLDALADGGNHQGVALVVAAWHYSEMEDIFVKAGQEAPLILIADGIEDPHNLGAIIRTAEGAGAHGIIIPKRGSVGLTATVAKTASGALEHLPVVRVPNIVAAIEELKKRSIWVYAADFEGRDWCTQDYSGGVALVVGAEGKGISRLVREKCDFIVSLPMRGQISSLNASVATGIVLYEIARQRLGIQAK